MSCGKASSSAVLGQLAHPKALGGMVFRSAEWKRCMCGLYRTILKLHAVRLSYTQRQLGDRFVRAEFHRHALTNEKYATIFYGSWYGYVAQLESGVVSREMTREEVSMLNAEQKERMAALRAEVTKLKIDSGELRP
jgi:hypothetical protein